MTNRKPGERRLRETLRRISSTRTKPRRADPQLYEPDCEATCTAGTLHRPTHPSRPQLALECRAKGPSRAGRGIS
jgi:hypothetical protein